METIKVLALKSKRQESSQKRKKAQTPNGATSFEMLAS